MSTNTETTTILEKVFKGDKKQVFLDLKSNQNGVFLRLSERRGKYRNSILISGGDVQRFSDAIDEICKSNEFARHVGGKSNGSRSSKKERGAATTSQKNQPREREAANSAVLFVSNLTWATTEADLVEHMKQAGPVVRAEILRRDSRSKGTGLVEYSSPKIAAEAIDFMNDSELDGRKIKVRADKGSLKPANIDSSNVVVSDTTGKAKQTRKTKTTNSSDALPAAEKVLIPNKVFIRNLAWSTAKEDLIGLFSKFGEVSNAEIRTTSKGRSLGTGVVVFANAESAQAAITGLNGFEIDGRKISVREFFDK